ncbi:WYL domain-containing protein [Tsukamurella soli]|uniref:WYL domain-containing protein n=1 Tax=Tsukamurella soli TaxID=644556 RepID=A0ABP8JLZ2_9ACTN
MLRESIVEAIESRREIEFGYDGRHRVVQPAALGESRRGKLTLLAYQAAGGSNSGLQRGQPWWLFTLAKMTHVQVGERRFLADPAGYQRNAAPLLAIDAQL